MAQQSFEVELNKLYAPEYMGGIATITAEGGEATLYYLESETQPTTLAGMETGLTFRGSRNVKNPPRWVAFSGSATKIVFENLNPKDSYADIS